MHGICKPRDDSLDLSGHARTVDTNEGRQVVDAEAVHEMELEQASVIGFELPDLPMQRDLHQASTLTRQRHPLRRFGVRTLDHFARARRFAKGTVVALASNAVSDRVRGDGA